MAELVDHVTVTIDADMDARIREIVREELQSITFDVRSAVLPPDLAEQIARRSAAYAREIARLMD